MPSRSGATVRMTVHGLVALDVIGAEERHIEALRRNYGATPATAAEPADVTIRFVEEIETDELTQLRLVAAAVSSHGFHLVDELDERPIATIPFGSLDGPCEIVYVSKPGETRHLTDVLRLAILRHSHVVLQAAAFEFEEKGVVVIGWPKSGKTGVVLGSVAHGGRVLGDDWIAIARDGRSMFALQPTVTISDWQASQLEQTVAVRLPLSFRAIRAVEWAHGRLPLRSRTLEKALPRALRALKVSLPAAELGRSTTGVAPSRVFLVEAKAAGPAAVSACDSREVVSRATVVNRFEWSGFRNLYMAWQFAHPGAVDGAMESLDDEEERAITDALSGLAAFCVEHTYPGALDEVFRAVAAHL